MGEFIRKHGIDINLVLSKIIAGTFVVAILSFAAASAFGGQHEPQQVQASFYCYTGSSLDAGLRATSNGEVPLASGVGKGGVAMLTYVNPETKAWSFVIIEPNGRACLVAHGIDYEQSDTDLYPPKKGGI